MAALPESLITARPCFWWGSFSLIPSLLIPRRIGWISVGRGFGFIISGTFSNASVVVETRTNLIQGAWNPIATNTCTNGSFYFNDSVDRPARYYRVRSP
jgi:hypothetical protein